MTYKILTRSFGSMLSSVWRFEKTELCAHWLSASALEREREQTKINKENAKNIRPLWIENWRFCKNFKIDTWKHTIERDIYSEHAMIVMRIIIEYALWHYFLFPAWPGLQYRLHYSSAPNTRIAIHCVRTWSKLCPDDVGLMKLVPPRLGDIYGVGKVCCGRDSYLPGIQYSVRRLHIGKFRSTSTYKVLELLASWRKLSNTFLRSVEQHRHELRAKTAIPAKNCP